MRDFLTRRTTTLALLLVGLAVGITSLTRGRAGSYDGMVELFWIGVLIAVIPAWLAVWTSESRTWTSLLVALVGGGLYLLKLFRSPFGFAYFDEQGTLRAVHDLTDRMGLFQDNPLIPIVRGYPGLPAATGVDALVAGVGPFVAGAVLIGVLHVVTPILILGLGEEVSGSFKVGGLAALVYMANPSFIYFDGQFAYESLGVPLLLAALLCFVRWRREGRQSTALMVGIFASALIATHHLTTLGLLAILTVFAVLDLLRRDRSALAADVVLIAYTGAFATVWVLLVAPYAIGYLSPHVSEVSASIVDLISRLISGQGPSRPLFVADPIPIYERLAALGAAALWCVLALVAALRSVRSGSTEQRALALVGLAIAVTAPLVFTDSADAVKRLWATEFIGLAVVGGMVLSLVSLERRRTAVIAMGVFSAVLVMGGATADSGQHIRFPGPFQIESDPISLTTDVTAAAAWLDGTAPSGARLFADRTGSMATGAQYALFPDTHTFDGSAPWRVFFSPTIDADAVKQLADYHIQYLFVDLRMAQSVPRIGFYFESAETRDTAVTWTMPPSRAALDKFTGDPRFARIYDNGSIVIYEVSRVIIGSARP